MRNWIIGSLALWLLIVPLTVGYLTAPCEPLTEQPWVMTPYRWRQQRFLEESTEVLSALEGLGAAIQALAEEAEPTGMAAAYRRAGRLADLALQLDKLVLPETPERYRLLGERLGQVRDTYALAAEDLLSYLGNTDPHKRTVALASLALADEVRAEIQTAVRDLQAPLCRQIWAARRAKQ